MEKITMVTCKYKPEIKEKLQNEHKLFYDIMKLHGLCRDLKPMPEQQYEMIKEHAKAEGVAITEYFNVYKKEMNVGIKENNEVIDVEMKDETPEGE